LAGKHNNERGNVAMQFKKLIGAAVVAGLVGQSAIMPQVANAGSHGDFYKGKTVTIVVRSNPGGGYDTYGRLIANHIGKHIPGNPDVIVQNMPGAGGIVAANYLDSQADQDGTVLAIFDRGAAFTQRVGKEGVAYDVSKWNLLGSATGEAYAYVAAKDAPFNSLSELKALSDNQKFSATGPGSDSYTYTELLQNAGMPVKLISGYVGTQEKLLAIIRGEVQGTAGSFGSIAEQAEAEGLKVIGLLGNVPSRPELQQLANFMPDSQMPTMAVAVAPLAAGRPFATTPNVPADRVKILQDAFAAALKDPELIAEAEKAGRPLDYMGPKDLADLYANILAASDDVIKKFTETPAEKVTAKLDEVGKKGKVITFQGKKGQVSSAISKSRTKITIGGKDAKRGKLKAGMECAVEYNPGHEEREASKVDCK
jgi:tripartite-type tricarboxylate transporter receptor subunit TctC